MSFFSCTALSLFEDPIPEEDALVADMAARVTGEQKWVDLKATPYEHKSTHLRRLLRKSLYDIEAALTEWAEWVKWRHDLCVDQITDEEVAAEREEGIFEWRGRNKHNMRCLVITGRALDPIHRRGTFRSFKRHLIRTIEQGLESIDDEEQDQICVIYDRRGLTFEHIDPNLYNFCKKVIEEARNYYNERLGMVYVIHVNVVFWVLFRVVLQPMMGLLSSTFNNKFVLVDSAEALLPYFEAEELVLGRECDDAVRRNAEAVVGEGGVGAEGGKEGADEGGVIKEGGVREGGVREGGVREGGREGGVSSAHAKVGAKLEEISLEER